MARRPLVTGHEQVQKNLKELAVFANRANQSAARATLAPLRTAARQNAPKKTGLLSRSVRIVRSKRSGRLRAIFVLGIVGEARRRAHLAEWGKTNRDGSVTPGSRFMTRAFDDWAASDPIRAFGIRFWRELEKRIARMKTR